MIIGAILFFAFSVVIGLWALTFTELGPYTQLPTGRRLARKVGKDTVVGHYLNLKGYKINDQGEISEDSSNEYYKNLKKQMFLGAVYTGWYGLPYFGGVSGKFITESELKYTEADDGSVEPKVLEKEAVYYTAPKIFIERAYVFGGIPIQGLNLVKFGISVTFIVTDVEDFHYKQTSVEKMINDSLESALRQVVENLPLEEVHKLRSEKEREAESKGKVQEIINITNASLKRHRYGGKIYDINMPYIQAVDDFAKAKRQEAINEAVRNADIPLVKRDVYREIEVGEAKAKARKALVDASGGDPRMTVFAEGMGNIKPGVTLVIGQGGAMGTFPLNNDDHRRGDNEKKPKPEKPKN